MNVWRDVTFAELRAGPGSVSGLGTGRRTRWWVLTLSCRHQAERHVLYRRLDPPQTPGTRRNADDVMPAPARVSCAECVRAVLEEMFS